MSVLTPEEKARIEAEERKRHEEEQYRNEIRSNLEQSSSPPGSPVTPAHPPFFYARTTRFLAAGILALLVACVTYGIDSFRAAPRPVADKPVSPPSLVPKDTQRYTRATTSIVSGQIVVRHGGTAFYKFRITPDMHDAVVSGRFNASGGPANDIIAVIADEPNYINWVNGHQAKVFWGTEGRETTGDFNIHLAPGLYYLAFTNRFAIFYNKDVSVNASINFEKALSE